MTHLLINATGLTLIALIIWWFWLYQPKQKSLTGGQLEILVENGVYEPAHIIVPAHKAFAMRFLRKDPSSCAEQVFFPDLSISANLAMNKVEKIQIPALEPGRYDFHCQMQMYRGQVEAK